jgi:hypothetical protein
LVCQSRPASPRLGHRVKVGFFGAFRLPTALATI